MIAKIFKKSLKELRELLGIEEGLTTNSKEICNEMMRLINKGEKVIENIKLYPDFESDSIVFEFDIIADKEDKFHFEIRKLLYPEVKLIA